MTRRLQKIGNSERVRAVRTVIDGGRPVEEVAKRFQVSRATMFRWVAKVRSGGYISLQREHRRTGRRRKLNDNQMRRLLKTLRTTGAAWTNRAVQDFVWRRFDKTVSAATASRIRKRARE